MKVKIDLVRGVSDMSSALQTGQQLITQFSVEAFAAAIFLRQHKMPFQDEPGIPLSTKKSYPVQAPQWT